MIIESIITILFIISSIVIGMRMLISLQLNGYRVRKKAYLIPLNVKQLIEFSSLLFLGLLTILSVKFGTILTYSITITITLSLIVYYVNDYIKLRTKFKFTARGTRFYIFYVLILTIMHLIISMLSVELIFHRLFSITLLLMSGLLAICVSMILSPLEFLNSLKYIKIAKNKLLNLNAIKIGISGSYGKTSCKNILGAMLAKKYKVIKTEGNRNTPMGICLTTNNMTSDAEVFIAEMGARRRGDIKKLCDIVKPTCALLTGISNQHMSEFGSLEKIYQTKSELIKALPRDGIAIFNGDDPLITKLRKEFTGDSVAVHLRDEQEVYAKNIKLSTNGISFEIFGLSTPFKVSTKLLGRHNVLNILMCSVMAYKLGISPNEIASALSELEPIPHRLQIIKNTGEITIIDDSYNANISGSIFALEVLKLYSGRKIVFSQGLVELGKLNNRYNRHLGAVIGKTADVIILTGQNTNSLLKGIDSVGFSGTVYRYKSFKEATVNIKEILKPGDVLLIQNDIP